MSKSEMCKRIGAACIAALLLAAAATATRAQTQANILTLSVQPANFSENAGGQAAIGTVTRNTADLSAPLVVTLASSDDTEVSLPATVTIAAGNSAATFAVGAVDDTEVDFRKVVNITATASNFSGAFATVTVEDDEAALSLSLAPSTVREDAGAGAVTATLSRTQAAAMGDLNITLSSSDPGLVKVPPGIVIPDGQTTVTFPVELIDNADLNGRQTVTITANRSFATLGAATATLIVNDDESLLEVAVSKASFSEAGGANAAVVTISRSGVAAAAGPVALTIASSDTSEATVPSFVVLAKGVTSVDLPVAAVDDAVVDGAQRVSISVAGDSLLPGSREFTVTDNDTPRLGLTLNTTQTSESNGLAAAVGTITRNTPITQDLVVNLRSSVPNQASVPGTVRIPAGAVSADFPIRAIDDIVRDGVQSVVITASLTGFPSVTSSPLAIFDNEGPNLRVTLAARETREKTGIVNGTVVRSGPTNEALAVTLVLSNAAAASFNTAMVKSQIGVVIPVGSTSVAFSLVALDNAIPDDIQNTTVTASAPGFQNGAATLRVRDDDDPAILTLSITPATYSEGAGPRAALATIRRNTATTSDVVVVLNSNDPLVARVPLAAVIPTGRSEATFFVSAVDDETCNRFDEIKNATISGHVAGFQDASADVIANDDDVCSGTRRELELKVTSGNTRTPGIIVENAGARAGNIRVFRRDELINTLNLVVDLVSSEPARVGAAPLISGRPTRVVIPAGRFFIDVPLSALDNTDVEGCKNASFSPSPVGFTDPTKPIDQQVLIPITQAGAGVPYVIIPDNSSIKLLDNETPLASLSVQPSTFNESGSSGVATGTVTRSGALTGDLQVIISSTDAGEASVSTNPAQPRNSLSVTIPSGELSASFAVTAVDDFVVDGDQRVFLEARVADGCYTPVTRTELIVRDNEIPTLTINAPATVREGATATATLTRNTATNAALTVALQSTDTSEVTVPASVTIPAGSASVTFVINGVQDNFFDGSQRVRIVASAPGFRSIGGEITVLATPALLLTLAQSTLGEGTTTRATVARNTPVASGMTVSIASNNASRLRVPSGVTIPAGSASVSFDVTAIDDRLDNGNASVVITASKTGLLPASATVSVLDNDPLLAAATRNSDVKLSSATAQSTLITLTFTGALDKSQAADRINYIVEAGDESLAIDSATYNAATRSVVLHLTNTLRAGELLSVRWNGVLDTNGAEVSATTAIPAR